MSTVVLTPQVRDRVIKVTGMLGSAHDGERANAAAFLEKIAREHKLPLVELLRLATNGNASPVSPSSRDDHGRAQRAEAELQRARREAAEARRRAERAERQAGEARQAPSSAPVVDLPHDWRLQLSEALKLHETRPFMSPWQLGFANDAIGWGSPTAKMVAKIIEILKIAARQPITPNPPADDADDWEDV